ncbi:MAG: hypothetical protein V7K87_02370 [Nostoc sp.]
MKFPTATANFSTSFHTATTGAEWHKIGIGDWGLGTGDWELGIGGWKEKYYLCKRSIDYPVFSVVEFVPERCAEIHQGTRSKILRLVCSVRVTLVNS